VVFYPDDFDAVTVLKPFSQEYENYFYVVYEDAYGEIYGSLVEKENLKKRFKFSDEEFEKLLSDL
jgi:hypothetical protein